jgi:hypothetical protein
MLAGKRLPSGENTQAVTTQIQLAEMQSRPFTPATRIFYVADYSHGEPASTVHGCNAATTQCLLALSQAIHVHTRCAFPKKHSRLTAAVWFVSVWCVQQKFLRR